MDCGACPSSHLEWDLTSSEGPLSQAPHLHALQPLVTLCVSSPQAIEGTKSAASNSGHSGLLLANNSHWYSPHGESASVCGETLTCCLPLVVLGLHLIPMTQLGQRSVGCCSRDQQVWDTLPWR